MKKLNIKIDKQVADFFGKNFFLGVLLIVLSILYVNNGFAYERQICRLLKSHEVLKDAEFRYYCVQKKYNCIGLRSAVKVRLEKENSPLRDSKKPNIKIAE
ncbi:MAG: hypothetical protein MJ002_08320 [Paludibacteraceae bacterium]|nr:hypothetical protein [Paludibacteraceae bacterium]